VAVSAASIAWGGIVLNYNSDFKILEIQKYLETDYNINASRQLV
jgi:hypothetical protein